MSVSWFHPSGRTYVASLFSPDGTNTLLGLSHDNLDGGSGFQWLTYDLATMTCRLAPFAPRTPDAAAVARGGFYGSATRDLHGDHYVVGNVPGEGGESRPIVWRVRPRVPVNRIADLRIARCIQHKGQRGHEGEKLLAFLCVLRVHGVWST